MAPRFALILGLLFAAVPATHAAGPGPRALRQGESLADSRLGPLQDLDGFFPFRAPESPAAWSLRAGQVRRQLQVALGLWPFPERTPLNAVVHGLRDQGDYTVEKVYLESVPGLFVTGNLYRPKGRSGKVPGILCPHGHWANGRFMDQGVKAVRSEIVQGAERFENGGRSVLQARCVTLARMGCVVFHYDMLGYADSQQLPMELVHGFARQRPAMSDPADWGFFSAAAEARFQSVMGLQTWISIRALDFLEALPEVDSSRLAVTGASGGGTQTFILGALDSRPAVAFPAVMVSTAMQGGCTCENASGLRINTGNVEIAALFAPKPLGLTGANDWTLEMPTKGFPDLQRLYQLLGARDNVMLRHLPHFGHNYNYVSRAAMYSWFNKHLRLGLEEPVVEEDYPRLTAAELTVWDDQHPRPPGGEAFERDLIRWLTRHAEEQLARAKATEDGRREIIQPGIEITLGRRLADVAPVEWEARTRSDRGAHWETVGLLREKARGEIVPAVVLEPKSPARTRTTAIVVAPHGKDGLFGDDGSPTAEVRAMLEQGTTVMGIDLLYQGESSIDGKPLVRTRRVANPREAAAYTFGYNHTVFQQRVHDVLSAIAFVTRQAQPPDRLRLVATPGAAHWAACARAVSGQAITELSADRGDFRFAAIRDVHDPDFVPGGAKYLDPFVLAR